MSSSSSGNPAESQPKVAGKRLTKKLIHLQQPMNSHKVKG